MRSVVRKAGEMALRTARLPGSMAHDAANAIRTRISARMQDRTVNADTKATNTEPTKKRPTAAATEKDNGTAQQRKRRNMPSRSPRPPYQIGRPMTTQRCTEEELEHAAESSTRRQNFIATGVVAQPPMDPASIGTRQVYTDMLGMRRGITTRLRVGAASVQHIGAGNYEKAEYWAAMATMYDTNSLFLTELAATEVEMRKLRSRLAEIGMTIQWTLASPDQGSRLEPGLYRTNCKTGSYPTANGPDGTGNDVERVAAETMLDVTEVQTGNKKVMVKIETASGARWAPLVNNGKLNFTRMESEAEQQVRRKQDGERRGGVAILMSAETAKLTARTTKRASR